MLNVKLDFLILEKFENKILFVSKKIQIADGLSLN